jgi:hypothetical protein
MADQPANVIRLATDNGDGFVTSEQFVCSIDTLRWARELILADLDRIERAIESAYRASRDDIKDAAS